MYINPFFRFPCCGVEGHADDPSKSGPSRSDRVSPSESLGSCRPEAFVSVASTNSASEA